MIGRNILNYAIFASSYLINCLSENELKKLQDVILFGSVAQNMATADSDIDLFFNVDMSKSAQKKLIAKLNKAAEKFYLSNIAFEFKLEKIENPLSIKVGKIEEWPDLKRSIASTGIILYGKYATQIKEKARTIFSIEQIGRLEGALLNKLYGYKSGKKRYPGLIKKIGGIKIKRAFIIPSEQKQLIKDIFRKYKVDYSTYDIWI